MSADSAIRSVVLRCKLCTCRLDQSEGDDPVRELCSSCSVRPEARRLGDLPPVASQSEGPDVVVRRPARAFTAAEKSLILKIHGHMHAQQLLDLLNERLFSDLGPDVSPYTMDQLRQEIGAAVAVPAGGHDWTSLRKLLVQARRNGTLTSINEQVINDFAIVFSLNPKQVMGLKDIVLEASEQNS